MASIPCPGQAGRVTLLTSSGNKPASGGAKGKRKTKARGEYTASIKRRKHQGAIGSMVGVKRLQASTKQPIETHYNFRLSEIGKREPIRIEIAHKPTILRQTYTTP